jgi:hypothetical protein
VVLNKGNLAQAMIASSAFPSLFSPIEIDGKLLVDGGVMLILLRRLENWCRYHHWCRCTRRFIG